MIISPVAGALGAEVAGVNLSQPLPAEGFAEIRRAFQDHLVLFFRGQSITPAQQAAFAERFGDLFHHPGYPGLPDQPEVLPIIKQPQDTQAFGGDLWHSDVSYRQAPALGSLLYAQTLPTVGGDTLFANQYLAFETLSAGMQDLLMGLRAVHAYDGAEGLDTEIATHPVVRIHPESGRKALYVNAMFTVRFDGMTVEESRPLLDYLYRWSARPEFTCRFRWAEGSLAFWDNRCCLHYAVNDYDGQRRVMHRVTVLGGPPE